MNRLRSHKRCAGNKSSRRRSLNLTIWSTLLVLLAYSGLASAAEGEGLQGLANNITEAFPAFVSLIIAGSYVAGMALTGAAILKFKAHKDNPTQVTLGQPIALLFIGAALLWLPSIIESTGETVFKSTDQTNLTAPGGTEWDLSGGGS